MNDTTFPDPTRPNPGQAAILHPPLPTPALPAMHWRQLHGSAPALAIARAAQHAAAPIVVVATDIRRQQILEAEIRFYLDPAARVPLLPFPDWECLPYDVFSPHPDIISTRLRALSRAPTLRRGIITVSVATVMQRLAPRDYVLGHGFALQVGETVEIDTLRARLVDSGYYSVGQVMAPGEYAVRGSLIDIFPMGHERPFRLDLFDDRIDSIRFFDPETQRSSDTTTGIELLPGREFPLTPAGIQQFRLAFRSRFEGDPQKQIVYREVSQGHAPAGIEFFLPLFFEHTDTLFDYLPADAIWIIDHDADETARVFESQVEDRYQNANIDAERRLLGPEVLYLSSDELGRQLAPRSRVIVHATADARADPAASFATRALPDLSADPRAESPYAPLIANLRDTPGRVLLVAETAGRCVNLQGVLEEHDILALPVNSWDAFLSDPGISIGVAAGELERGARFADPALTVITESALYGEKVLQQQRRSQPARDPNSIIRSLAELNVGDPVVHDDHGVGRYRGLSTLSVDGHETEFLTLEYRDQDKLYVPVLSLHQVSRYVAGHPEDAPLHRLGSDAWDKAKRRAMEKAYDVAAELLEVEALRGAREGNSMVAPKEDYARFIAQFPFEETPDQAQVIDDVLADLAAARPMDRLVCGDVGFGKTEIALRAAFLAVYNRKQVAVLVPTTLLAQQHFETFRERFAEWPVAVELLSRFRSRKAIDSLVESLRKGYPDIVIGTHRLLQKDIAFKDLGLLIIDEEHRFGVRQKEQIKRLRSQVDILTLTATPIPRTLNMALADLRSISIIATPPRERLSVRTFVRSWNKGLIREACLREIRRGGQAYFVHNEVRTIDPIAAELAELLPEADIRVAHGQMPELELERIMRDFYHQRFNILVCTTIIESGIDVPSANTIVLNRAHRFGLAQLHQLRGRVGRSHHQAYAYLLVPDQQLLRGDAAKRLEAIAALDDLGAGFALASHDLEIRGAGELLGETQSGLIDEIGFTLYTEYLRRAIDALKKAARGEPAADTVVDTRISDINLHVPALFPETFIPDVHARLVMYKRIANATDHGELRELEIECVDRFGLLPAPARNLFKLSRVRLDGERLGIVRIDLGPNGGRVRFNPQPSVDPITLIELIQSDPGTFTMRDGSELTLRKDLADIDERIGFIESLVSRLGHAQLE